MFSRQQCSAHAFKMVAWMVGNVDTLNMIAMDQCCKIVGAVGNVVLDGKLLPTPGMVAVNASDPTIDRTCPRLRRLAADCFNGKLICQRTGTNNQPAE